MLNAKPIKLITIITDRNKGKKTAALLNKNGVNYHIGVLGHGTAPSRLASYSGLCEPEKTLIFCITAADRVKSIFKLLRDELDFEEDGSGIAFTIPVASASCLDVIKLLCAPTPL